MADFIKARWENVIMANYAIDPEILMPYLPKGVELDEYNGNAYLSLVGFTCRDTRLFNIPLPFIGSMEAVNLRFYVKRTVNDEVRRGVVFINEVIPNSLVALTANLIYKERFKVRRTKRNIRVDQAEKKVVYKWRVNKKWNRICAQAMAEGVCIRDNSFEEFICEHYYGFSCVNKKCSMEYKVEHPRWNIHYVKDFDIHCNFQKLYGDQFRTLDKISPHSVMMAEGSDVSVNWRRHIFK